MRTNIVTASILLLGLNACGLMAARDQQDAMYAQMAQQQAANQVKQREQIKQSFQQQYDAQEPSYAMMRSKLELYESQYQDWLQGVTPRQKNSNEFATVTKVHDELKERADKLEADHTSFVQWYEQSKDRATNDDNMKLAQSYTSFGQRHQLYFSNYIDLHNQTLSISARSK